VPYLITFPMSGLYPMSSRLQSLPRLVSLLLAPQCPISGSLHQGLAYQAVTASCHCYGHSWCPISSFRLTTGSLQQGLAYHAFLTSGHCYEFAQCPITSFILVHPILRGFYSTVSPTKPSQPRGVHTVSPGILSQHSPIPTWSLFPLLNTSDS